MRQLCRWTTSQYRGSTGQLLRSRRWNKSTLSPVGHLDMTDAIGTYLNQIGEVALLTAAEERELSQVIEDGRDAADPARRRRAQRRPQAAAPRPAPPPRTASSAPTSASSSPSPGGTPCRRAWTSATSSRRATSASSTPSTSSTGARGYKFSTYATFWIRQSIGRALDQKGNLIRIPGDRAAHLRSLLRQAGGDADQLDAANAELYRLTSNVSLDKTVGDDGDASLGDLIAGDRGVPRGRRARRRSTGICSRSCSASSTSAAVTRSSPASGCSTARSTASGRSATTSGSPPKPPGA